MKKDLAKDVAKLMEQAGQPLTITDQNGANPISVHAFLEPLRYKNKMYIELQPSEVGRVDDGCCLYLGPSDVDFLADDFIYNCENKRFVVQRVELIYLFKKPLYRWAIVRPCVDA